MQNIVGPHVAKLRRVRRILQKDFAARLGVSGSALSQWERGVRPFPPEQLTAAAELLETDVGVLDGGQHRITTAARGRLLVLRPPYPPGANMAQVKTLGRHEWDVHEQVHTRLDAESYRVMEEEFPRDSRYELLVALKFLARGGKVGLKSPGRYKCTVHTMHDLNEGVGDHLLQPVIQWVSRHERIVLFSQVWINCLRFDTVRTDFLIWYKPRNKRGYWLYVEIDDKSSHEEKLYREKARAVALTLPGLRYENYVVQKPWFFDRLISDIRGLQSEAARRRRDALRRSRRLNRQRHEQAAARLAMG